MATRAPRSSPAQRPVARVTGASWGLGEGLAWRFTRGGRALVLVARRAPRLRSLARRVTTATGMPVRVMAANLAEPGAATRLAERPSLVIGRADEVAVAGVQACLAGEVFCVPGAVNLAANWGARVLPRSWARRMAGAVVRQVRAGSGPGG